MEAKVKWRVVHRWSDKPMSKEDVEYWLTSMLSGGANILRGDVIVEGVEVVSVDNPEERCEVSCLLCDPK